MASDRRRSEPLTVNRPYEVDAPSAPPPPADGVMGVFAGLAQMGSLQVVIDGPSGDGDG